MGCDNKQQGRIRESSEVRQIIMDGRASARGMTRARRDASHVEEQQRKKREPWNQQLESVRL